MEKYKPELRPTVTSNGFTDTADHEMGIKEGLIILMDGGKWGAPCSTYLPDEGETEEDMWNQGYVKVEDAMWGGGDDFIWVLAQELISWEK